jgi:hypothetical protein
VDVWCGWRPWLAALALAGAACGQAPAQPPAAPSARLGAVLVADPAHHDLVFFGGKARSGIERDTWLWAAGRWRRVAPPAAPPARSFAAAAPDPDGGVLLFGGDPSDPIGPHDDTWRWDGVRWSELHPRTVPAAGAFRTMGQGSDGAPVLVVFAAGGEVDMWTWRAGDWVAAAGAPPWRDDSGLALDRASGRLLQVGGTSRDGRRAGDTWAWNGGAWAELRPAGRPGGGPAAVASLSGGPLLYEQDGTWAWRGGDWTLVEAPGQPRWLPYAALAPEPGGAGAVLLTGAVGEPGQTWRWSGARWTRA